MDIYRKAESDINAALAHLGQQVCDDDVEGMSHLLQHWDTRRRPHSGESALEYGPAHVVWADENWDCAEWCLKKCDDPEWSDFPPLVLEIIRRSLRELIALPKEIREPCPEDYDDEFPENFPPPAGIEMVRN